MALRKGLPAKKAFTDADDTRWLFRNLVICDALGYPRAGVTSPVGATLVTATATMAVNVAAFSAIAVRDAGVVLLANDGVMSVTIGTAPVSNSRLDIIVARQDDSSSTVAIPDADDLPKVYVIPGVAAAIPSKPPVPDGSVELATVTVSAGNTNTNAMVITQSSWFTTAPGSAIPVRNNAELTALAGFPQGTLAYQIDNGVTYRYYGLYNASTNPGGRAVAGWKPWETSVPIAYSTVPVNYNPAGGPLVQEWTARGGRIQVKGRLTIVTSGGISGGQIQPMLPFFADDYYVANVLLGDGSYLWPSNALYALKVAAAGTDRVNLNVVNTAGTYAETSVGVTGTVPAAQQVGTLISWEFEYDPA